MFCEITHSSKFCEIHSKTESESQQGCSSDETFCKNIFFKDFHKACKFIKKEVPAPMFSRGFLKNLKKTFFAEYHRALFATYLRQKFLEH